MPDMRECELLAERVMGDMLKMAPPRAMPDVDSALLFMKEPVISPIVTIFIMAPPMLPVEDEDEDEE